MTELSSARGPALVFLLHICSISSHQIAKVNIPKITSQGIKAGCTQTSMPGSKTSMGLTVPGPVL